MLIPHLHPHLYENMRKGDKVQDHLMIHRPAHIKASPGKKKLNLNIVVLVEMKYSANSHCGGVRSDDGAMPWEWHSSPHSTL